MKCLKDRDVKNAILIGGVCSVSYLGVYVVRNILGAVTPQMIADNSLTTEYIGTVSSLYFIFYAVGQLISGIIGDKIKARYMLSIGMILAGICNFLFPDMVGQPSVAKIVYSLSAVFLSMIFAPMTKVIAENTRAMHAVRCSMGLSIATLLGSPFAGVLATMLVWENVFRVGSITLIVMGILCFVLFWHMEKAGIVKYNQYAGKDKENSSNGIKLLIQNRIVKFTFVSIITGIVRTTVVFWLPTYLVQYLGFSAKQSTIVFTIATFVISMTPFIAVFVYEKLHSNMELTIFLAFLTATVCFFGVFIIKKPVLNIVLLVLGIMSSNCASNMIWSKYCPSLRDTGMVSTATGFLNFTSYGAASASSAIFANAVSVIGWGSLILVWFGFMLFGVMISLPFPAKSHWR